MRDASFKKWSIPAVFGLFLAAFGAEADAMMMLMNYCEGSTRYTVYFDWVSNDFVIEAIAGGCSQTGGENGGGGWTPGNPPGDVSHSCSTRINFPGDAGYEGWVEFECHTSHVGADCPGGYCSSRLPPRGLYEDGKWSIMAPPALTVFPDLMATPPVVTSAEEMTAFANQWLAWASTYRVVEAVDAGDPLLSLNFDVAAAMKNVKTARVTVTAVAKDEK